MSRRAGPLIALPVVLSLTGCVGLDAPPAVAPVEVVAVDRAERTCSVSRRSMTAGTHETFLLAERGPAEIRIVDPAGSVRFGAKVSPRSGSTNQVDYDAGTYRVRCLWPNGQSRSVELTVVPAE